MDVTSTSRRPRTRAVTAVAAVAVLASLGAAVPAGAHERSDARAGDAAGGRRDDYTIEAGDTLWDLARRFTTSIRSLLAVNEIADPDRIIAGDTLDLPSGAAPGRADAPEGDGGSGGGTAFHVVQPGETLSEIAARHGVTASELAAANGLDDTDLVWVGSRLRIASEAPALPSPRGTARHRVRPGETLSEVAARYEVSVSDLAAANGIGDPDRIRAGATLRVPGGWRCPVPDVTRMVNDYGAPRSGGRFHEGIDLFAARGSPVVAPVSGTARYVEGSIGGLQVWLEGDDGHRYLASHLESRGESGRVDAGAVIGGVGDSGNAAGSPTHAHFELHPDGGAAANPFSVLERACEV